MTEDVFIIPTSFAQRRLWFLDQLEPGTAAYNMPACVRLTGAVNLAALEHSLNRIIQRHEILRTTFADMGGEPVQVIAPNLTLKLPLLDLQGKSGVEQEAQLQHIAAQEAMLSFDLAKGPLLRIALLRFSEAEHVLLFTMHHIISDGWSIGVFIREMAALYEAFLTDKPSPLDELPIQYADFALWQREWLQGETLEAQLSYWKQQLGGSLPLLELPADRIQPAVRSFRGARQAVILSAPLSKALRQLGQREGATLFISLLAAFKLLLYRHTGQSDIIVGSPIAGRNRPELGQLIGFFINTLVLRTDLSGDITFRELLGRVREVALGAYSYQDLPFEKIVEEINPERRMSHTPLFQVMFNLLNFESPRIEVPGLTVEILSAPEAASKFDLTLYAKEQKGEIELEFVYNADVLSDVRMAEMLEQFTCLLSQIVNDPDEKITRYSLVTASAELFLPDPTQALGCEWEGAISARFSQKAKEVAEHPAIVDKEYVWTYQELDALSNQLAHYLRATGIQSQETVAIYGQRSASMVWAILGALKAGAAFLILDPSYPTQRLIDCLRVANPMGWLQIEGSGVIPESLQEYLSTGSIRCRLELPRQANDAAQTPLTVFTTEDPCIEVGPNDLAYIAFTSGSTGKPKGILGTHRPLSHFLQWHSRTFGLGKSDRFSMLSGLSHDPLLRDIFTPLWLGATLCIPEQDGMTVPGRLAEWMRQEKISVTHITPAMLQLLTEGSVNNERADNTLSSNTLSSLRYAFFGGDVLTKRDVTRLRELAPSVTCVNFYGATETPQAMGYFIVPGHEEITAQEWASSKDVMPIGEGIGDVQMLILNASRRLAGIGEVGELYIRTAYLSGGYINDGALTSQRFITNPFTKEDGDRLYKTGDLARYLPGGNIEFLGRIDNQVKIRGFRVELGEVEAAINGHPLVEKGVVIAREDQANSKRLEAFIVAKQKESLTISQLRSHLKQSLPDYMLPSAFTLLDTLPLTPNGKVDREALYSHKQEGSDPERDFVAPRNSTEATLADIWVRLLGVERVGVYDDFFELGGHSLLATQLISRIRDSFHVEIPLRSLFKSPTVASLSVEIVQKQVEMSDDEDIDKILAELEQLSQDEAQKLLAGEKPVESNET